MRHLLAALCLLACCAKQRPVKTESPQSFDITVTGKGFEPPRVEVAPGQKIVLRITRKAQTCADDDLLARRYGRSVHAAA